MVTRDDIVAEARRWVRTPFKWQQSVRGRGCDCKGLVAGVARTLGLPEGQSLAARAHRYHDYKPEQMLAGLEETLVRVEKAQPGDVLALEFGKVEGPRHLAILTDSGRIVHCYPGMREVVEVPMGTHRRVHSIWSWPSLGGL